MDTARAHSPRLLRWAIYAGLWLLLCSTFGSQLYFAGYMQPWAHAVADEAVYWMSWWLLAPLVFWWCRRIRCVRPTLRVAGLRLGAGAALFIIPLISQALGLVVGSLL